MIIKWVLFGVPGKHNRLTLSLFIISLRARRNDPFLRCMIIIRFTSEHPSNTAGVVPTEL